MSEPPAPPVQLTFDLPLRPATGAGDFVVGACNGAAVGLVDRWPDWPQPTALIVGPPAAGKTHLAAVWRERSEAGIVAARDLDDAIVDRFDGAADAPRALVVEDIDRGIGSERVLFHLINQARETGGHLLLTSRAAPGDLAITLPDLRSRLRALAPVAIAPPDDAVLAAVLVKLFADRQIDVEPAVVAYLARRMERSYEAAGRTVADLDRLALARKRPVTRAMAAEVLAADAGSRPEEDGGEW
jgi:chromosomal replication initiation ATPase DnaA